MFSKLIQVRINSKIISKHKLKDGDKIVLGHSELIFKSEEPAHVEFLAAEEMSQEAIEVTSLDA